MSDSLVLALGVIGAMLAYWAGYRAAMKEWNAEDPWTVYGYRRSKYDRLIREGYTPSTSMRFPILIPPPPARRPNLPPPPRLKTR